jgi:hypothetical protein
MSTSALKAATARYETAASNAAQANTALVQWTASAAAALADVRSETEKLAAAPLVSPKLDSQSQDNQEDKQQEHID